MERLRMRDVIGEPKEVELLDGTVWPIITVLPIDTMLLFATMEDSPPDQRLDRLAQVQTEIKKLIQLADPEIDIDDIPSVSIEEGMAIFEFAAGKSAQQIIQETLEAGATGNGEGDPLPSTKRSSGRSTGSATQKAGSRRGGGGRPGKTSGARSSSTRKNSAG
jgi:hypothetical protein